MNPLLPLRIARRDLRGGLGRFRLFLACLALGVAAIATVGSLAAAIQGGLGSQGAAVLGGDGEVRLTNRPASEAERRWLAAQGVVSELAEMRAMARTEDGAGNVLVELKAVDGLYPLYGGVELRPAGTLPAAFAKRDGVWGAVAEPGLLDRLGIRVGDRVRLGDTFYQVRAELRAEPDRLSGGFTFGPRIMVALDSLSGTGLLREGSLVQYAYRLRLPPGANPEAWAQRAFAVPEAGWRVRERTHAAPSLGRTVDRMRLYLTLAALTTLAVGGIGVGNAVLAYLAAKRNTIAILKSLGASQGAVLAVYASEIAILAALGILAGLVGGALVPLALSGVARRGLGVPIDPGPHWAALGLAAGAGALVAAAFSLAPLAAAARAAPSGLFRALVAPVRRLPPPVALIATAALLAALGALVFRIAGNPRLALGFLAGIAGLVAVLGAAALGLKRVGRGLARNPKGLRGALRLAGANLSRPGAPAAAIVVSLGLGLTLLSSLVLVAGSLSRELDRLIPKGAPAFFFIDIQPDQAAPFEALARATRDVHAIERVPMLRGRIVAIAGRRAEEARVPESARWALRGDRGLTHAAKPPPNADITAGAWWPPDYAGPPLISFDANLARAFGIGIGDTLTYNVLGREITGRIANLRRIDWTDLRLNFTGIFSPGVLDGAPHTEVATVQCDETAEEPLLRAVGQAFPNVTAIRVRDVLGRVKALLNQVALALAGASGVSIVAGILVLAGAVAAGRRARLYDAAVLHALGATRGQIVGLLAAEFALLGGAAGLVAVGAGWLVSWLAVTRLMDLEAAFLPGRMLAVIALGAATSIAFGLLGTWRALARSPAALLRSE